MKLAHRIALDPNNKQATYLAKAAGTARFSYNWALAEWQKQYRDYRAGKTSERPSQHSLRRKLNSVKAKEFPWMLEVTKCAPQMAIIHLEQAFQNFFKKRSDYPKFRRKWLDDRFTLSNDHVHVKGSRIRIPNLGWVRMREPLRFSGKIQSATISRRADRWFVSITMETEDPPERPAEIQGTVGVDLGVSRYAVLSTGEMADGPKAHTVLLKRQKRLSKSLSRKKKGSANRHKAQRKLAKLHARIANIRSDAAHKLTSDLTRRFEQVVIEDLNVRGMMQNRHLARSIADVGFYEVRRQLEYKAGRRGGEVILADRWFPSSKTCSVCGEVYKELSLSEREWTCTTCSTVHDRDRNAARNLAAYAASSAVEACGEEGSGMSGSSCEDPATTVAGRVKPASGKQEVSSNAA